MSLIYANTIRVGIYYPPDDRTKPAPAWNDRPMRCLGCHALVPQSGHTVAECLAVMHERLAALETAKK